jgi:hypothetical protein
MRGRHTEGIETKSLLVAIAMRVVIDVLPLEGEVRLQTTAPLHFNFILLNTIEASKSAIFPATERELIVAGIFPTFPAYVCAPNFLDFLLVLFVLS